VFRVFGGQLLPVEQIENRSAGALKKIPAGYGVHAQSPRTQHGSFSSKNVWKCLHLFEGEKSLQHPLEILSGITLFAVCHGFRRAGADNGSTAVAALGAQVDEVVGAP
jgi:hypothetical protein